MLEWDLLGGVLPTGIAVLGAAGLAWLLLLREGSWWRRGLPVALAVTAAATGLCVVLVEVVWRPFPDALPLPVVAWLGVGILGVVLSGVRWHRLRRVSARLVVVAAAAAVLLAAVSGVNLFYGQYPTVGAALGTPLPSEVDFSQVNMPAALASASLGRPLAAGWTPPPGMPRRGAVSEVSIPGPTSGFAARPGWVYLPPAYLSSPRARLPVLVLLAGQPGAPRDWFDGGQLAQRLDRYAAAHAGLAPVVVVPDDLGAVLSNPLCLDSKLGRVATYLDTDVPAWIERTLQVEPNPARWAIGGYSHGGTCALQLALRAPQRYPTFVDVSGQDEPTLGSREATVSAAFDGDEGAFRAVNPLDQLARQRYPGTAAMIVVGEQDSVYRPEQERVFHALQGAGVQARFELVPGGHTWAVWGPGLEQSLPWLGTRLGLTG